jgi:hypothetical protein
VGVAGVWGGRPDKKRNMWVGADVLGLAPGADHPHITQLRCSGHGASRVALQHLAEGGEWATVRVYSIGEQVGGSATSLPSVHLTPKHDAEGFRSDRKCGPCTHTSSICTFRTSCVPKG